VPGARAYGGRSGERPIALRRLARPLLKGVVRHTSAFAAYGSRAADYLRELGGDSARIHKVWNTIDVAGFQRAAMEAKRAAPTLRGTLGVTDADTMFLYVGALLPLKYVDDLLLAYAEVRQARQRTALVIVGDGPERHRLMSMAKALDLTDVRFVGHEPLDRLPAYYAAADVFVLPSTDTWGLVVNEAMSAGLPVVVSDAVGAADDLLVSGETGFMYPHRDTRRLAELMTRLAADVRLRTALGASAATHIARFTLSSAAEALAAAVEQAAQMSGEARD
jgi:glycosyltransferase involved in cell wall biosynthesis